MSGESTSPAGGADEWSADELIPFGKYILLERIESGATAAVYRANVRGEPGFKRLVAVKRILPHMAGDPEFVNTFVREAKTTARLNHANICPIYELGKVGESLYMAMECVVGKDLGRIRRRLESTGKAMPPVAAAWIAARLCDALDYAHTLRDQSGNQIGIIHRDLSPTNIVISYEGHVKLIDFGLAKAVGRAQQTNVDALKRKLGYMSPEMVRGRPVDARSDIFGVGIALYEMLTGRRLFAGKDDIATLKLVGKASVPPPSALLEDPPDDLELIIMRALERDADDRWQTAAEMAEVLNEFIREQDPTFGVRQMADFMRELFGEELEEDERRIGRLLTASADPNVVRQRRIFFSSPGGAAARAKAEVARRMSTRPPVGQAAREPEEPATASMPAPEGGSASPPEVQVQEDAQPTRVDNAPRGLFSKPQDSQAQASRRPDLEEEATAFYEGGDRASSGAATAEGPFSDEPTHYLQDQELDSLTLDEAAAGGFDEEEPTTIYFNKEEGVGVAAMLDEINDVEPAQGPLNRPIVAPDIEIVPAPRLAPAPPIVAASTPPPGYVPSVHPAPATPASTRAASTTVELPSPLDERRGSRFGAGTLALIVLLVGGLGALILLTPLGEVLSLRSAPAGVIELRTDPPVDAQVTLDGVYRGRSPLRMSGVEPGMREIGVEARGYAPATRQVQVFSDRTTVLEVKLEATRPEPRTQAPPPADQQELLRAVTERSRPTAAQGTPGATGTLAVSAVPWARVFVNGEDTGRTTPLSSYSLPPGSYDIGLRTGDGRSASQRVVIHPGETTSVNHRF